jgi:hypothetical protein
MEQETCCGYTSDLLLLLFLLLPQPVYVAASSWVTSADLPQA